MKQIRSSILPALVAAGLLLLTSCAARLAPVYDQALFDGLTRSSTQIMELFASVGSGTDPDRFSDREKSYNKAIGAVDALAIQSRSRPMPSAKRMEKAAQYLDARGIGIPEANGEPPSAAALDQVSAQLVKMKETDREKGLSPTVVKLFKNNVIISMDQALTYEAFLKR